MLPVPAVRSCLGTSPGLKAFGLAVTLPAGPIFPDTGEATVKAKIGVTCALGEPDSASWLPGGVGPHLPLSYRSWELAGITGAVH